MAIHVVNGDLLNSDCTVIAHQCNCFSTMGSGIAKQIKEKYSHAYDVDKSFPFSPRERLGKCSVAQYEHPSLLIFNLYGQFKYGRDKQYTDYDALFSALKYMFEMIHVNQHSVFSHIPIKIGMPYGIGAGRGGGNWDYISSMIHSISDQYNLDVYFYKL